MWPLLPRKLDFFSEIALFTYLRAHTHTADNSPRDLLEEKSTAVEEFFTKVCKPGAGFATDCSFFFPSRFPVALSAASHKSKRPGEGPVL